MITFNLEKANFNPEHRMVKLELEDVAARLAHLEGDIKKHGVILYIMNMENTGLTVIPENCPPYLLALIQQALDH